VIGRRRRVTGAIVALIAPILLTPGAPRTARAHDLVTPQAVEQTVADVQQALTVVRSKAPAARRAEAHLLIARRHDTMRDLLNRDIAAHGQVQGLPSKLLIERLRAAGAPFAWSDALGRYAAPVDHYRAAAELDPRGPGAAEATFGWLSGAFADSFRDDPLQVLPQATAAATLAELGERFVREWPRDANVEEARFITAIAWVRVARATRAPSTAATRARESLERFARDYPDSLRSAAVPVLLGALP
jgi:hypothetical protein